MSEKKQCQCYTAVQIGTCDEDCDRVSEKKKTAVEWLALELYEKMQMKGDGNIFDDILNKALQMEREQIEKAYGWDRIPCSEEDCKQYYTDTYGK